MLIKSFLAFGAGFISFLSPCVLPLIPGYISYISGESLGDIVEKQKKVILKTVLFSLGFSLVFISFGATASFIGNILLENSNTLRIIAGIIIIIFSLQLIGILNLNFLNQEKRFQTKNYSNNLFFPVLVGAAFGFGWTPCIGPVLGSILTLAAVESSIGKGILLLSFYSLGLAIPFILSGYGISKFLAFSKNFRKNIKIVSVSGGVILLITGILILTNKLQALGYFILEAIPILGNLG
ncbi:cytochrome c biogenesis protein CcdA [Pelagibacteraceae bacterium]|jgi:cytochrome c-type biogenesis protein|nr:cytochrome c biogenesis protein CcdA [Pelagibacteraceae bacterium]|tara:strand:- start:73 stop:786 length:714 start_codon:yes stop_codon:yes gene_type:complete